MSAFAARYDNYFDAYGPARGRKGLTKLDGMPRVILVPGCGMFAAGKTRKDAAVAADLYQQTIRIKTTSGGLGDYEGLPDADLFDMEYWSLEQAKLGKKETERESFSFRPIGWGQHDCFRTAWTNNWFSQKNCKYCQDCYSDFADVSAGDAWLKRLAAEKNSDGYSIVIARNDKAMIWCRELEQLGSITLVPITDKELIASQYSSTLRKIRSFEFRSRRVPGMGIGIPRVTGQSVSLKEKTLLIGQEILGTLSKTPGISTLLQLVPVPLWRFVQKRIGGMM